MRKSYLVACWLIVVFCFNGSAAAQPDPHIYDPFERFNRGMFWFNDKLDIYVAEPVARGYKKITPRLVRNGVSNFFDNLQIPKFFVSSLLQLKFKQAARNVGRFGLNTVMGLGGLIDVAKHVGLDHHQEDLGLSMGYWGIPTGPYLVLPLLGPSNFRDALGRGGEVFLHPSYWAIREADLATGDEWAVTIGLRTVELVDIRSQLLDAVEAAKASSVDYYFFVQSAYYQYRRGLLYDGNPPGGGDDWLEGGDDDDWMDQEEN